MNDKYTTRYTLLERAKDPDDPLAWEEFIEFYKNYIYVIVRSMSISSHDADDILQQVVFKLWKTLPEYQYKPNEFKFRHWVSRITKNEVISFIRKQKSLIQKLDRVKQNGVLEYINNIKLPEIDTIAEREWKIFITNTAMKIVTESFSENALKAFRLHSKGISTSDIAEELGASEISVYKYIARIKKRLIDEINRIKLEQEF